MTEQTPTSTSPPSTFLRELVAAKLGRDPAEYARERRATQDPPLAWARIADELKAKTDVYLTPEAVRRWVTSDDRRTAEQAARAA
jgi:hypothetical protein